MDDIFHTIRQSHQWTLPVTLLYNRTLPHLKLGSHKRKTNVWLLMVATTFACRVLWRMWRLKRLPQKCGADTMAVANCGCQPMPTKQALSFLLFFMWPQLVCVVLHLWAEGETIKYDLLQTLPHYENLLFYVRVDVHLCSMDG